MPNQRSRTPETPVRQFLPGEPVRASRRALRHVAALLLCGSTSGLAQPGNVPGSYLQTVGEAQRLLDSRDWAGAASMWQRAVQVNPHVPDHWLALGQAYFNAGRYRESLIPFERALDLGAGTPSVVAANIARAHALLGGRDEAIQWLARAIEMGLRNRGQLQREEVFATFRADPRFRKLAAIHDSLPRTRVERWQYDLDFLEEEAVRMHVIAPGAPDPLPRFRRAVAALRDRTSSLTDNQMTVEIMRAMALLGDGHTGSWPEAVRAWKGHAAPIQLYDFVDGLYVIAADAAYPGLAGARVVRIGGHAVDRVRSAVDSLVGKDHELGSRVAFPRFVRYPQVLNGLGLLGRDDVLPLVVLDRLGRERQLDVPVEASHADYDRQFGRPGWVAAIEGAAAGLPLYLRNRQRYYWFEHLPDQRTIYFQFNRTRNATDEPLDRFVDRMFAVFDSSRAERLIVDLRFNYGGNTALVLPLVHGIISRDRLQQRGALFVIVGRGTFSAAQNTATFLQRHASPIFVGEPSGSGPNFVGEDNLTTLPYSGLGVGISDLYWQTSWPQDRRVWIAPLLYTPPTFEAYLQRRDPAMEAIASYRSP